ncbi:hypothetical protein ElyMa_003998100 [Elysia marginata]|uniref:Uncharacterized protein n=1 Tax=Elysia marginata TaxID=1093978 RepID=A0AAV4G0T1_9GAST|nr:hypothetical protein ElyMa_003998100 [Elysia marginata]
MAYVWSHLSICLMGLGLLLNTHTKGQSLSHVLVEENRDAVVSFTIPDTEQVKNAAVIFIALDPQDGTPVGQQNFYMFVYLESRFIRYPDAYKAKVSGELDGRDVRMALRGVNSSDAGYFRCYDDVRMESVISNCGEQLVVLLLFCEKCPLFWPGLPFVPRQYELYKDVFEDGAKCFQVLM